ncbi:hypothetical protein ScPMuIL_013077 [Solemya velum]
MNLPVILFTLPIVCSCGRIVFDTNVSWEKAGELCKRISGYISPWYNCNQLQDINVVDRSQKYWLGNVTNKYCSYNNSNEHWVEGGTSNRGKRFICDGVTDCGGACMPTSTSIDTGSSTPNYTTMPSPNYTTTPTPTGTGSDVSNNSPGGPQTSVNPPDAHDAVSVSAQCMCGNIAPSQSTQEGQSLVVGLAVVCAISVCTAVVATVIAVICARKRYTLQRANQGGPLDKETPSALRGEVRSKVNNCYMSGIDETIGADEELDNYDEIKSSQSSGKINEDLYSQVTRKNRSEPEKKIPGCYEEINPSCEYNHLHEGAAGKAVNGTRVYDHWSDAPGTQGGEYDCLRKDKQVTRQRSNGYDIWKGPTKDPE